MKYFVFFFVLIGCIAFIPQVSGAKQNLFEGNSSFERLPDIIIPDALYEFELKFQITDSPYWLRGMTPVVDISPKTDASNVHINFERIPTGFYAIFRIPVTLYVDQNISSEKIFLNISFVSENSSGDEMRSSWSESTVLNISQLSMPAELPSSQDYEFETMTGASCTYDSSVCFGTFHNGTTIPIQCDYRHSCGVISFDKETYKLEEKSPLKQFKSGIPINEIECKENLVLVQKYDDSPACVTESTKQKLIERGWTEQITDVPSKYEEMHDLKKLLTENNINYLPDKLVVNHQITLFAGDPACGAVVDTDSNIHWFGIDSVSNPRVITVYDKNPNQCVVNTHSCFCDLQIEMDALTINELDYFTPEEQEKYAHLLIDYLYEENINRTPKFMIGKHNVNYTDPLAIGYCGKIWGTNTYGYFSGAVVNGEVRDYGIDKELPLLCAITDDAQYFGKVFGDLENEN